jgi:hypothetical protein
MENGWIAELGETERKVILAATSHVTLGFDFDLLEEEFSLVDAIFADLDAVQNGAGSAGYADIIPASMHRSIWAATCAFARDIHAPVDNLSEEGWSRIANVHAVLDTWGLGSSAGSPSP